jgi:signal transduction histidine kinase
MNLNHELSFQDVEVNKNDLVDCEKELSVRIYEKIASELLIANKQLAFQNEEKEKRAAELFVANKELAFQIQEKEKRAAELVIANEELRFQNEEKEKRAAELIIANQELAFQNTEKEARAQELLKAYIELKKAEEFLQKNVLDLKEIMFITSHKVRAPIANILGLSTLLDQYIDSPARLKEVVSYMKQSATSLDAFTKELTAFIASLKKKWQ